MHVAMATAMSMDYPFPLKQGHNILISTISRVLERVYVPGTVSDRLRSSAPHMRSVRKDDMILQRHLRDGFFEGARYSNSCHRESRVSNTS